MYVSVPPFLKQIFLNATQINPPQSRHSTERPRMIVCHLLVQFMLKDRRGTL